MGLRLPSCLPDHKPLTLIYQHEEALTLTTPISLSLFIYSLGSGMKESYTAQNSLELNPPPDPPHHSIQNKELSPPKKGMDIKIDYLQLPADPSLWLVSEIP